MLNREADVLWLVRRGSNNRRLNKIGFRPVPNNFGNNRLRLELENYSSLMGQNCLQRLQKVKKVQAREKCK